MTCIVKVIHNSGQPRRYTFTGGDKAKLNVRIQHFPADLDAIAAELKECLVFKRRYEVIFDFKSVSDQIRNYYSFRDAMIRLLYRKDPEQDLDAIIEIVKFHMAKGKHPDFTKYAEPKFFKKISNYINSITGTSVPVTGTIEICKRLMLY